MRIAEEKPLNSSGVRTIQTELALLELKSQQLKRKADTVHKQGDTRTALKLYDQAIALQRIQRATLEFISDNLDLQIAALNEAMK